MDEAHHKDDELKVMKVVNVVLSVLIVSLLIAVIILACKLKNKKKRMV